MQTGNALGRRGLMGGTVALAGLGLAARTYAETIDLRLNGGPIQRMLTRDFPQKGQMVLQHPATAAGDSVGGVRRRRVHPGCSRRGSPAASGRTAPWTTRNGWACACATCWTGPA